MLDVRDLTVRFGGNAVLDGVSLDVAAGEIVCLLGPSGSGKSTLLRVIAGIEYPTTGQVFIDGIEVAGPGRFVQPEQRGVGMVFQDYALFPHLTAAENVGFGLKRDPSTVQSLLARLGLDALANSYPHRLSGGESQRVALARAMAPKPRILLMDEPFSALDSRLRDDVRRHTLDFIRESRTTTVIVTHDPNEAMRIGDRIALLNAGRLVQFAPPAELYSQPASLFAARFFSDVAAVPGECRHGSFETPLGNFSAPRLPHGIKGLACIRPQHVRLAPHETRIAARVGGVEFCGDIRRIFVYVDGLEQPVLLQAPAGDRSAVRSGARVFLEIDRTNVPIVPTERDLEETLLGATGPISEIDKESSYAQPRSS